MKVLKTFEDFVNEAAQDATAQVGSKPAPAAPAAKPEDDFDFSEHTGTDANAPVSTPPAEGTDPNAAPADPNAPVSTPPADGSAAPAGAGPDISGGGASTGGGAGAPPVSGAPGGDTSTSIPPAPTSAPGAGGAGAPAPADNIEEAPEKGDNLAKSPGDYVPPVKNFKIVVSDKKAPWVHEYPDGGGVKKMEGYDIDWKDLNTWLDQNQLSDKKQAVAEYLLGETDHLDDAVRDKVRDAIEGGKVGDKAGETEVEYDDDETPYVADINTVIVKL